MVGRSVDSGSRGKGVGNRLDWRGQTGLGDEPQAGLHFLHGSDVVRPAPVYKPQGPGPAAICAPLWQPALRVSLAPPLHSPLKTVMTLHPFPNRLGWGSSV